MGRKILFATGVCLLVTVSFFSGCINIPEELTQFSIMSFDVEPGIITQGDYTNLSWVVLSASSVNIDNGIGNVALTGHRMIQPTRTTTYTLTASNQTTTKNATVTIIVIPPIGYDEQVNVTDTLVDVYTYDYDKFVTMYAFQYQYPQIFIDNLDIIKANFTLIGKQATVSLKVRGIIQNAGNPQDPLKEPFYFVQYEFSLRTLEEDYTIVYINQTAYVQTGIEAIKKQSLAPSEFSAVDDTLTISFNVTSLGETYQDFFAVSTFMESGTDVNMTVDTLLTDFAPNRPMEIIPGFAQATGSVGESIQFSARPVPYAGLLPYNYHWDFGDGTSSILKEPIHIYTQAGTYVYTVTITDRAGDSASLSVTITITA